MQQFFSLFLIVLVPTMVDAADMSKEIKTVSCKHQTSQPETHEMSTRSHYFSDAVVKQESETKRQEGTTRFGWSRWRSKGDVMVKPVSSKETKKDEEDVEEAIDVGWGLSEHSPKDSEKSVLSRRSPIQCFPEAAAWSPHRGAITPHYTHD